jgi:hypothetical protein
MTHSHVICLNKPSSYCVSCKRSSAWAQVPHIGHLYSERHKATTDIELVDSIWDSLFCIIAGCSAFSISDFLVTAEHYRKPPKFGCADKWTFCGWFLASGWHPWQIFTS